MSYVISILIIVFLSIMIFTNTKAIIIKLKQNKLNKANKDNSEVINNDKGVSE